MGAINLFPLGLLILGLILNVLGWFLMARNSKGESVAIEVLLILFIFPAAWILSAVRYRLQKTAFWVQTIGVLLIAGGSLLNLIDQ